MASVRDDASTRKAPATPEVPRGLLVWASGSSARARERQHQGAEVVTWLGADPGPLERAGVPFHRIEDLLGAEGLSGAEQAGRSWARVWGRVPLVESQSFRDLAVWRETSLLWSAEEFLAARTAGPRLARTADLGLRLLAATCPAEVDVVGLPPAEALLLARAARVAGVLFHDPPRAARPLSPQVASRRKAVFPALARLLYSKSPPPPPRPLVDAAASAPLLMLGPGPADAGAFRPLLEAVARELAMPSLVVPTAEIPRWATRRARGATADAKGVLRTLLARLRGTPALLQAYLHRGVGFADLATRDLETLLLAHLPAMVELLEAAIDLVSATRPALVLLAGTGWDEARTLVHAAQAAGVPAVLLVPARAEGVEVFRHDGGPRPAAEVAWEPGAGPQQAVARLRDVTRGRVMAR